MRTSIAGNCNNGRAFARGSADRRRRFVNNRAFTLLELIVVMAIIALIASFAVPQVANFLYADQLKVSVRKLIALIHHSSQLAQQRQEPYLLVYRESDRSFVLRPERVEDKTKALVEKKEHRLQLVDSVTLRDLWSWYGGLRSTGDLVMRFNRSGYVEPTILHLRKEGGDEISVFVSPFLGKVTTKAGYVLADKETVF